LHRVLRQSDFGGCEIAKGHLPPMREDIAQRA